MLSLVMQHLAAAGRQNTMARTLLYCQAGAASVRWERNTRCGTDQGQKCKRL